ncbi:FixH family protein [Pseudoduganella lutea]|uniref:Cytochrome oxidase assembly protein n=1 Tax=Pseudoduganella lutea TaxID=321985 RepID=A0A4P6KXU4_9BURK|nr:FixH family protein [Pseudoduganella lutea]QBE63840.1 cytochrome oxidase assembly protein [Pseudoduganella lutea]
MQTISATPWYRERWPWLLMAGPAIVLVAGFGTAWLAFAQPDALVVGDYYKRGKAINQDLRRDRAAATLGAAVTLRYDAAHGVLQGRLSAAVPLHGALQVHLAHATQPEKDLRLLVRPDDKGDFAVSLPLLERSRWTVLVEDDKRTWRLEGQWLWPAQRTASLASGQNR